MGTIYSYFCQDCGFSLELRVGVGMMFFDPKNFLGMIPEEDREKAADLLDQKGAVLEEFRFQTFSCPACKHYESKLKGVISLGGRQISAALSVGVP